MLIAVTTINGYVSQIPSMMGGGQPIPDILPANIRAMIGYGF